VNTREYNFDGLIGPTHNFAGLSFGNVASTKHRDMVSSPRAAALQGLEKMKLVSELGIGQGVLPPLRRPRFEFLRELGFTGTDHQLLEKAYAAQPGLLAVCYSASNMWTANAATVSPSADCANGRVNFTPANLSSTLHRSIEFGATTRNLRSIFSNADHFLVHDALPSQSALSDEGAANHTRLCVGHADQALEMFVYGANPADPQCIGPTKFPARQTWLASQAIARKHGLDPERVCCIQQNPAAIDAGVFHNDVIAVGNQNVLLCHEMAFAEQAKVITDLKLLFERQFGMPLHVLEFSLSELAMVDAVSSYLFNSQLLTRPDGKMTLVCPVECQENAAAFQCTRRILSESTPIDDVVFLDLRQSMSNGGGPACLRLRVAMTDSQAAAVRQGVLLTGDLYASLKHWIERHYREELSLSDLRDPRLAIESMAAIESLAGILGLPADVLLDQ
jgi:succinylarginine dihydrolase